MIIDVFSKYGCIIPMKRKNGKETADAFKKLFQKEKPPKRIWSDFGGELYNKNVQAVLDENNVKLYSTQNKLKSCIVERWIRTMKRVMYKYSTASRTRN